MNSTSPLTKVTSPTRNRDRTYLYPRGVRVSPTLLEQDQFVDRSICKGLWGSPGRNSDSKNEKTRKRETSDHVPSATCALRHEANWHARRRILERMLVCPVNQTSSATVQMPGAAQIVGIACHYPQLTPAHVLVPTDITTVSTFPTSL